MSIGRDGSLAYELTLKTGLDYPLQSTVLYDHINLQEWVADVREPDTSLGNRPHNTHRSLQELVSINAWFSQDSNSPNRFTLHAGVSFTEERLGGGEGTKVIFKLAVRKCDIIFRLPNGAPFRVDPSSVRAPKPLNPKTVLESSSAKRDTGGRLKLGVTNGKPDVAVDAHIGGAMAKEVVASSEQTIGYYHEAWKKVGDNHAWSVSGRDLPKGRLAGPVFDSHAEPRLTIIDGRSEEARANDDATNMNPVASIFVRCLREDLDVYDIEFKDPHDQKRFETAAHRRAKEVAACEVIKAALVEEGLVAGDLTTDPYAEMTICDVAITIIDGSA